MSKIVVLVFAGAALALASDSPPLPRGKDLADLGIEDLMRIEVTSVSKKGQELSSAPAAIYVITQEDIRRSAATSIPELLRMVPGLAVARIDSHTWAISSRGFNGRFANKMLVLVDGRSVYSPLFSGTYWDSLDVILEDIERIEVIRGPGAVMWGANAVNGVINIITRDAHATRGVLASAGGGTLDRGFAGVRQGGALGRTGAYRVYAKYRNLDNTLLRNGSSAMDGWDDLRGGFRADWTSARGDSFTLEGDVFRTHAGHFLTIEEIYDPMRSSNGNLLGRWTRHSRAGTSVLQVYYDRWDGVEEQARESRNTADLDFQHEFQRWGRHQVMFGAGYRFIGDRVAPSPIASFEPAQDNNSVFSGFVQDEVQLVRDRLVLSLGTKIEHNGYTGAEVQPGMRLEWAVARRQTLWGAVSRAVRTPSRRDRDLMALNLGLVDVPAPLPVYLVVYGNKDHGAEHLLAHEMGYRVEPRANVSLDFTGFYNRYTNVQGEVLGEPELRFGPLPYLAVPATFATALRMRSFGAELAASWTVRPNWKLAAGYTWLNMDRGDLTKCIDPTHSPWEDPRHQFDGRSYLDLPGRFSLDLEASYSGGVAPYSGAALVPIPAYLRTSARLGRRFSNSLEISLGGDNLTNGRHFEFYPEAFAEGAAIGRSVTLRVTWRSAD